MRYLLLCIALNLGTVTARGSAGEFDLEVLHWEKTAPRELRLDVIEARDKKRKIIHIRYGSQRIARLREQRYLMPAAEAEYDRAFNLLCKELRTAKTIRVLLAAERGYSQIRNRKGHFTPGNYPTQPLWAFRAAHMLLSARFGFRVARLGPARR